MKTKDFYYDLPKELIAQHPEEKRDHSRLLVLEALKKVVFFYRLYLSGN